MFLHMLVRHVPQRDQRCGPYGKGQILARAGAAMAPAVGPDAASAGRSWGLYALYCGVPSSPNVSRRSPSPGWVAGLHSMRRSRGFNAHRISCAHDKYSASKIPSAMGSDNFE